MATSKLCSLDDVLGQLGIKETSNDKVNDLIDRMIISKTAGITKYIGMTQILAQDYTEYYNGDGGIRLYTNNSPINSISELNADSYWEFESGTEFDASDYRISTDGTYILLKYTIFTKGNENIKVIYNAGYTEDQIVDLKDVCIEEVTRSYNEKLNVGIASRTDSKGGVTRVEKGWMKQSLQVMDKYRKWTLL